MTAKEMLSGIFSPMCTPFTDDKVDLKKVRENIEKMNASGLLGYFVLGTNGEYKSLTGEEKIQVLDTVLKHASSDKVIMAGTGGESTYKTIELTKKVADMGAKMVSLLMPHFFAKKIDDDVLKSFILEVADASPVPVVLYNNPSVAAGVTIRADLLRAVSSHENVVGMKDSSRETYKENVEARTDGFHIMSGSAGYFLDLVRAGGVGGVLSLANIIPDACVELHKLQLAGKTVEADELNERLVTLNKQVSGTYGVAGVKAAMDIAGFHGGNPRRPLPGVSPADRDSLKEILHGSGFLT